MSGLYLIILEVGDLSNLPNWPVVELVRPDVTEKANVGERLVIDFGRLDDVSRQTQRLNSDFKTQLEAKRILLSD